MADKPQRSTVFVSHINTPSIAYLTSREAVSIVFEPVALIASLKTWGSDMVMCSNKCRSDYLRRIVLSKPTGESKWL